ncbi:MAG: hypothetical protein IT518_22125, partial [Burkholderiales bacterium]|nr:hypothetical protein [Burkholderiales bacterium]
TATLTITLGNSGLVPLVLTQPFTDPMPAGMTITSGNTGMCTGVVVAPTLITLPAGNSISPGGCTIVVTVTSSTPGDVRNITSALVAGSIVAPAANAPLAVGRPLGPTEPIPVDSPAALLLAALAIALLGARHLVRR